jgi:isoleucyl-tRNA synthetase
MIELNKQVNWYPENIGTQRFHKWLEGARDWCISRSRYFGTPIPVWMSEDSEDDSEDNSEDDILVIKSIRELENYSGLMLNDIHPEYVNDIVITHPTNGKTYKRVPDIFDCWFESGSVPFAQYHYPFENKDAFEEKLSTLNSLSDFIVEGLDQTRGWFYTLLVLSTALFDKKPAHNIMVVGTILDEHRKKISKKTKNYVDPLILIDNYGADAIRLYLLQSQITNAEPLAFKEDDIKIINKDLFQFNNSVAFLVEHITNQKHHNVNFNILAYQQTTNPMDKWILLNINNIQSQVITLMDNYQIAKATRIIIELIEDITNWYVKFNRDRLKGKAGNEEWIISTSVLFQVIKQYIILLAPFAPFLSQSIYKELSTIYSSGVQFVHMEDYNKFIENKTIDGNGNNYLETFELLKRVSKLVRSARMNTKTHTSSKTPIKFCEICMDSPKMLEQIASCIDLIQSELNVIDIKYSMLSGNLKYKVVPNKPLLGKKYKKLANEIYKVMETITYYDTSINKINCMKQLEITLPSTSMENYIILEEEFAFEPIFNDGDIFDSNAQNNILIKIDFTYDAQIEKLAHLKRFIADVQQTRKHMGLKPWNKIAIHIYEDDFDIISDNINLEYIMKRLECEVIPNSEFKINEKDMKIYKSEVNDDDNSQNNLPQKKIVYAVVLCDC